MQNDLFLNGKKYISVNRASKETGYSQDYIGQLCRHGKVPAKLVGRTWYVDIGFLSEYKNLSKSKNERKLNNVLNKEVLVQPSLVSDKDILSYEHEDVTLLPTLKGKKSDRGNTLSLFKNPAVFGATFLISTFIMGNVLFSWLQYLAPQQSDAIYLGVSHVSGRIIDGFKKVKSDVQIALVASTTSEEESSSSQGIVVFPDSPEKENLISRIKNSFSDEVEILSDEGGESGVIRPIFKSGYGSENYAFVIVPVENKI